MDCQYFRATNQNPNYVGFCDLKKEMIAVICCENPKDTGYCPKRKPLPKKMKTLTSFL